MKDLGRRALHARCQRFARAPVGGCVVTEVFWGCFVLFHVVSCGFCLFFAVFICVVFMFILCCFGGGGVVRVCVFGGRVC